MNARTREISRKLRDSSVSSSGREGSIDRNFDKKTHSKFEVTTIEGKYARSSGSWKLVEALGMLRHLGGIASCARSASRGIAWHRTAHLGIPRAPRGGTVRPWQARCVATRLTDGTGRPLARHYYPPDAPSRATVPTATARAPNGLFRGATGPSAVGPRHRMLGLAPERWCGRRRHAYAARRAPDSDTTVRARSRLGGSKLGGWSQRAVVSW